ncbi:MAG: SpoIIE family protein phosphatase [Methylococcaceae bacterium]
MLKLIDNPSFNIIIVELDCSAKAGQMQPLIKQVNQSAAKLLGYSEKELINQPINMIYSSEKLAAPWQIVMTNPDSKCFEGEMITKAQTRLKVLLSCASLFRNEAQENVLALLIQQIGNGAEPEKSLSTIQTDLEKNIFQCREIESALAESEERFRQMAEMTGEWLWEQDPQGYYIYSSTAVNQILGFSQDEVIGKHYTELLTAQDRADQQFYAASHRPFYGLINHYRHKDGHQVFTESTGLPIISSDKSILKWRGVDRDITAKKHFQDALIESERHTRLIIESSLSAIIIMDSYGIISDWNHQAEKMFGWSRNEAIGQPLGDMIVPPRFRNAHRKGMETFLRTGFGPILNRQIEHVAIRRNGAEFPVEFSVSPLKVGDSYIFSGFIHDITARKAAEQEIRQAQVNLAIAQSEIKIAQQIQATLLPSASIKSDHFEITGVCIPADKVGGDYFDYFFRDNDRLDMVMADVSGHSIGPALFMVETRSAIRTQVNTPRTPAETLNILNNFLFEDLNTSDFFITLFYLQYDIPNEQLKFANAGHPQALLLNPLQNQCRQLDADGLILGVRRDVVFEEKSTTLAKDDVILIYTDGLTEAENANGEFFGLERVRDVFIKYAEQSPQKIIDAILNQLKDFAQKESFNDDITLMVFKRF